MQLPEAAREGVPHHLLDVRDPATDDFSAGDFHDEAHAAIAEILAVRLTTLFLIKACDLRWFPLLHTLSQVQPRLS